MFSKRFTFSKPQKMSCTLRQQSQKIRFVGSDSLCWDNLVLHKRISGDLKAGCFFKESIAMVFKEKTLHWFSTKSQSMISFYLSRTVSVT